MAKIFSPSGETEFFQITEIQKAFEREILTGEKIEIIPGAKEVTILREAPIRAEFGTLYEQFRDKVLNPVDPFQPPAINLTCLAWVNNGDCTFDSGPATGVTALPNPPELVVTINQNQSSVARWNNQTATVTGSPAGANYVFASIPFGGPLLSPFFFGPVAYYGPPIFVPSALSASVGVAWWNPGAISSLQNSRLVIGWNGQNIPPPIQYDTGFFTCNNIPANNSAVPIPIATVTADFSRAQYSCQGTLQNFTFTNLYP